MTSSTRSSLIGLLKIEDEDTRLRAEIDSVSTETGARL